MKLNLNELSETELNWIEWNWSNMMTSDSSHSVMSSMLSLAAPPAERGSLVNVPPSPAARAVYRASGTAALASADRGPQPRARQGSR